MSHTHEDTRNRLIITVWKHDEWHYAIDAARAAQE
jgi:hypothetical protein